VRSPCRLLAGLAALAIAGCGTTQYQNQPLGPGAANPERRSIAPPASDRPVVLMAFSGGGSRAAALAEAVLRDMAGTTYVAADGLHHELTDDVRLISSVSGGSVAAAWFGLHGAAGLDELRSAFLARDNMQTLQLDAVNPITWFRLAFTSFTTIRAQEALFDDRLFHHATMDALNRPDRPFIVPNATDMAGGETFTFTPQRFDDICSAFDALQISTAVAASAAVPIALSPVDFKNNSVGCQGSIGSDTWARIALSNPYSLFLNLPGYRNARYTNDLRHGQYPFRDIEYLHLLDGGLADNLGTKTLRSALIDPTDHAGGLNAINRGLIRKLVVILVNARSDPPNKIYQQPGTPGLVDAINTVISTPIEANTASSQLALEALLTEIGKAADAARAMNAKFAGMQIYGITVDYDQIPADTPEHRDLRDQANLVPTSWTLTPAQLDVTERAGRFLFERNPCYRRLLGDLGATPPPGAEAPVDAACVTVSSH
jgi:NTE family protein